MFHVLTSRLFSEAELSYLTMIAAQWPRHRLIRLSEHKDIHKWKSIETVSVTINNNVNRASHASDFSLQTQTCSVPHTGWAVLAARVKCHCSHMRHTSLPITYISQQKVSVIVLFTQGPFLVPPLTEQLATVWRMQATGCIMPHGRESRKKLILSMTDADN